MNEVREAVITTITPNGGVPLPFVIPGEPRDLQFCGPFLEMHLTCFHAYFEVCFHLVSRMLFPGPVVRVNAEHGF